MLVTLSFLTGVGYIIVLEIVLGQLYVLPHAELNRLEHFGVIVKLIVCKTYLFETLGYRCAEKHPADTFVSKQVATQVYFFEGGTSIDQNFK